MFRKRCNETDAESPVWRFHVSSRPAAGYVARDKAAFLLQTPPDRLEVKVLGIAACCPHRHRFDQTKNKSLLDAEIDHVIDFVVIHSSHRDHIDLYRRETGIFGGREPCQDFVENIPAADRGDAVGTKGIQTDVDAPHTGFFQWSREGFQSGRIGTQG